MAIRVSNDCSRFLDELFVLLPTYWKILFFFVTQEYKPPEGVSSSSPQVAYVAVAGCQDYGQIGMTLACLLFTFGAQKDSSVQKTGFPWYPVNESFIVAFLSSCSSNSLEQITHKEV